MLVASLMHENRPSSLWVEDKEWPSAPWRARVGPWGKAWMVGGDCNWNAGDLSMGTYLNLVHTIKLFLDNKSLTWYVDKSRTRESIPFLFLRDSVQDKQDRKSIRFFRTLSLKHTRTSTTFLQKSKPHLSEGSSGCLQKYTLLQTPLAVKIFTSR